MRVAVAVAVGLNEAVAVGLNVAVEVAVGLNEAVAVGLCEVVELSEAVALGVLVSEYGTVAVAVKVNEAVDVGLNVAVGLPVAYGAVAVADGASVILAVAVADAVVVVQSGRSVRALPIFTHPELISKAFQVASLGHTASPSVDSRITPKPVLPPQKLEVPSVPVNLQRLAELHQ